VAIQLSGHCRGFNKLMDIANIKTCRQALDVIDEMLAGLPVYERNRLWNVLTALRGPDDEDIDSKKATTAIIRSVALPKAASITIGFPNASILGLTNEDSEGYAAHRCHSFRSYGRGPHFDEHAVLAFASLELVWGRCNPPNPKTPTHPAEQSASAVVKQQYDAAARDASVHNRPYDML